MQKIVILIAGLLSTLSAFSQKKLPNPKIGKNETEVSLFYSTDQGYLERKLLGCDAIYRVPWGKSTKLGGGVLVSIDKRNRYFEGNVKFYGALFADITQFIGKRQLWSVDGRIGHGLYKEKYEFEDSTRKGFGKSTAGMHYSIGPTLRIVASKKILITVSVFMSYRNFRGTFVEDYYSPPSTSRDKYIEHYQGAGFRFGIVF